MNIKMNDALLHVFNNLGIKFGTLVDIGAWDGIYESNSRSFVESNWESYLIEADPRKYKELVDNNIQFNNSHCFNFFISENTNLDEILGWEQEKELDFLQIDIDGKESTIIQLFLKYNPKVIVTEFNPTIPLDVAIIQIQENGFGSSLSGMANMLMDSYILIGIIGADAVFLRKDLSNNESAIFSSYFPKSVTYSRYFFSYSGLLVKTDSEIPFNLIQIFLNSRMIFSKRVDTKYNVPWHLVRVKQPLLAIFRGWPQKKIEKFVYKYFLHYYYLINSRLNKK